jgi:hypothetical protein
MYCEVHTFSSPSYGRSKAFSKWALHIVWFRASSFKWEYPLLYLISSSSFLHFLRLLVTSIPLFIFRKVNCCRRQFLCKMWPILFTYFTQDIPLLLHSNNTSSFITWSVHLNFSILHQHHISKPSRYFSSTAQHYIKLFSKYRILLISS